MGDSKTPYSAAARKYMAEKVSQSAADQRRYRNAKAREAKFNEQWVEISVNINEIVDKYAPDATQRIDRYKYIWTGERYAVIADMITGAVRVYDRLHKAYLRRDGTPSRENFDTHFKIKKRKDM